MKLADMEVKLDSARLLTWKAAMLKDAGENFTKVCLINIKMDQFLNRFLVKTKIQALDPYGLMLIRINTMVQP